MNVLIDLNNINHKFTPICNRDNRETKYRFPIRGVGRGEKKPNFWPRLAYLPLTKFLSEIVHSDNHLVFQEKINLENFQ